MSREVTIKIHSIEEDGYPDMDKLTSRVAFVFDGGVFSGWPLDRLDDRGFRLWEASEDACHGAFADVRYWIEAPEPWRVFAPSPPIRLPDEMKPVEMSPRGEPVPIPKVRLEEL